MPDFVWLNGQYLPRKEAKISLFESGLLYGYGIFETLLIYNRKPFKLTEHYDRLKTSARHIRMPVYISLKSLTIALYRLIHLNNITHGFARLALSSSEEPTMAMRCSLSSERSTSRPQGRGSPEAATKSGLHTSMILVETGHISPDYEKYRQDGGAVIIYPYRRSAETQYYRHKTLAYMENLLARRWAFKNKAIEAIFINTDNYVMEGTRSSLFIVKDRKVFTPPIETNILAGVTRNVVIGLCTKNAIKVREKPMDKEEIFSANEVFLTSSLMEIMPVTACKTVPPGRDENIETKTIGDGTVGLITHLLQISYRDLLETS